MKERPIPFNGDMVRAIRDGRKTQTRRVIKPQPPDNLKWTGWIVDSTCSKDIGCVEWNDNFPLSTKSHIVRCPYGAPGDRLWVKETWAQAPHGYIYKANYSNPSADGVVDLKSGEVIPLVWKSSRFMPRAASRILLEIVKVRVERVQEIGEADAIAEGATPSGVGNDLDHLKFRAGFQYLWDSINAKGGFGWDTNPWVWVVEFKQVMDYKL